MEQELEEYLSGISLLLNGQIRGALNAKAREENLKLIQITMGDIFEKGIELGKMIQQDQNTLDNLKTQLKDDNTD